MGHKATSTVYNERQISQWDRTIQLLQYMEMPCLIDAVNHTIGCCLLRSSKSDEVNRSLKRINGASEQRCAGVGNWCKLYMLKTL